MAFLVVVGLGVGLALSETPSSSGRASKTTMATTVTTTGIGAYGSITNTVLSAGVLQCGKGDTVDLLPPPGHVGPWKPTCGHRHGTTTAATRSAP